MLGRCLFCSEGQGPDVYPVPYPGLQVPPHTHSLLFPQRGTDLMGRRLRVAMLPYFPLSDHKKSLREEGEEEEGSVLLTPRDSLDVRIINTMAAHLNFTYELVEPPDGQWGVVDDHGNWTGVVGMIQQERADLSFCLTITSPRLPVMDFSRIYTNDPLVIISLKPKPLPQYLSTVRPLTGELWEILALSIAGWGFVTWLLQKAWSWVSGRPGVELDYALLYSWGTMLANPPTNQSLNVVERVLLGWWLVFCLIITTAYRSSLVAHLTVQGKSAPINSFQDLLDRDQWAWGSLSSFRMSAYVQIFQKTPDLTLRKMYEKVEIREAGEGLSLVLRGRYSFITGKYYIQSIIAMNYTDDRGYTPLYISRREYTLWAGFIWAFRKGAPFGRSLSMLKQRLLEAGLVNYWTNDVMETRIRNDKKRRGKQTSVVVFVKEKVDGELQVVLGLSHLLSVFLLLLLGYSLAFLVLLAENFAHRFPW
ncbi:glutamate receptor ionotropic, delta-1-like [Panulirus ornatus]|uniref:glutamate receptor ionotropic, delta-1-like n=1 Tax=Panulirus ornatus TaxID=150431 RepID=UPI003A868331